MWASGPAGWTPHSMPRLGWCRRRRCRPRGGRSGKRHDRRRRSAGRRRSTRPTGPSGPAGLGGPGGRRPGPDRRPPARPRAARPSQHHEPPPGTGHEDGEQVGVLDEPPRAAPSAGPDPDRRDHHVALVALEGVDGADPQVEGLDLVGVNASRTAASRASAWARNGVTTPTLVAPPGQAPSSRRAVDLGPDDADGVPRPPARPRRSPSTRWRRPGGDQDPAAVEAPGHEVDQVGIRSEVLVEDQHRARAGGQVEGAVAADVEAGRQPAVVEAMGGRPPPKLGVGEERHVAELARVAGHDRPRPRSSAGRGQRLVDRRRLVEDHQVEQAGDGREQVVDVGERPHPQGQGPGELVVVEAGRAARAGPIARCAGRWPGRRPPAASSG